MVRWVARAEPLVAAAAPFLDIPPARAWDRVLAWLGNPPDAAKSVTGLHHTGFPVQLCLSTGAGRHVSARFIADPGFFESDATKRHTIALRGLDQVLADCGAEGLSVLARTILDRAVRREKGSLKHYGVGTMWLVGTPGGKGAGFYVDMTPWWGLGWSKVSETLRDVLARPDAGLVLLDTLSEWFYPSALALEGLSSHQCRVKIYMRLTRPTRLDRLGLAPLSDPRMVGFTRTVLGENQIRLSGLVAAAGFDPTTGDLVDVKLDICGCPRCIARDNASWSSVLDDIGRDAGIDTSPLTRTLAYDGLEVAFVGQGLRTDESLRINLYLGPRLP